VHGTLGQKRENRDTHVAATTSSASARRVFVVAVVVTVAFATAWPSGKPGVVVVSFA
jgi:hypothetical protein